MCRIAGWLHSGSYLNYDESLEIITKMTDSLKHGGPDDSGVFISDDLSVVFGHRRLSILDLSSDGNQPMKYNNYVITFNGEIYNFEEIRSNLAKEGYNFSTKTDTEVILKAFEFWGFDFVNYFKGMFAFAIWDIKLKKLFLVRDRLGVKPLYYYLDQNILIFSSELKALHKNPYFYKSINKDVLNFYFLKGYLNESESIFNNVYKVLPGSILEISENLELINHTYWDINNKYFDSTVSNSSIENTTCEVINLFDKSIKLRMISDVEIGVFLSGGIDSTLVAAFASKNSSKPIKSFTIGFDDSEYDESPHAEKIARELNLDYRHLKVSNDELFKILPDFHKYFDEPYADISALPTLLVSKFASNSVKVILSGDGGDELFGGYSKYEFVKRFSFILKIPISLRYFLYFILKNINISIFHKIISLLSNKNTANISDKIFKLRETLIAKDFNDLFNKSSYHVSTNTIEIFTGAKFNSFIKKNHPIGKNKLFSAMGVYDLISYLPGDILQKVDRASMAYGLEAREPFLDHDLIEYSFSIRDNLKFSKDGKSKFILKNILKDIVDEEFYLRPKQGFSVPINDWMKNILSAQLIEISEDSNFFKLYNFNQEYFKNILNDFLKNKSQVSPQFIWYVFCFYNWSKEWA
jgi:asparagine synthase (glutamine-hydrolysing)